MASAGTHRLNAAVCALIYGFLSSCTIIKEAGVIHEGRAVSVSEEPTVDNEYFIEGMSHVEQPDGSHWCWAACGEMATKLVGEPVEMETFVADEYKEKGKGEIPLDQLHKHRKARRMAGWPNFSRYGIASERSDTPLPFATLKSEIINNQPILWAYSQRDEVGHMVIIYGVSECETTGEKYLYYFDSDEGHSHRIPYSEYALMSGDAGVHMRSIYF